MRKADGKREKTWTQKRGREWNRREGRDGEKRGEELRKRITKK